MNRSFDLVVIGGGAAGLTAARDAVRRGARTALISAGPLGGDCTHTGCVPSKTLLAATERGERFADAMAAVHATVARVAATEDAAVLQAEGIEVIAGRARLAGNGHIDVDGDRLQARHIIIATGAAPAVPPVPGLGAAGPLTSDTIFDLQDRPDRLAVLGGGTIGVELGQAFAAMGSSVTIIEAEDRLLPREEPDASAVVADTLTQRNVTLRLGARLHRVDPTTGGWCLGVSGGPAVTADAILVAVGRTPSTDGLDLDAAGVETDERGDIRTEHTMATTARGVWAIGDVNRRMPFTHAAAAMARIAVHNALSRSARLSRQRFDPAPIPWVTFTTPEVARVGMTETEAAAHHGRVAHLPLDAVDRAIVTGATAGFVKVIAGPRRGLGNLGGGRILGATIVAPTAGEMIHEPALAMRAGMFTGRLAQTTHAYPTWSTAVQQAAAQFFMTCDGHTARPAQPQT